MQTREYSRWETGSRRSEFIYPETQLKFKGGRISFIEKYGIKCWRSCRNCTRYIVSRLYRSYPEEKCRYSDVRDSIRRLRIAFAYENNIDGTRVSKLLRRLFEKLRRQIDLIALWKKDRGVGKAKERSLSCSLQIQFLLFTLYANKRFSSETYLHIGKLHASITFYREHFAFEYFMAFNLHSTFPIRADIVHRRNPIPNIRFI